MPIRIVFTHGQYRPTFFCDHCGRPIAPEHGKDGLEIGNYLFVDHAVGRSAIIDAVFVIHKKCTLPFAASLGVPLDVCAIEELDVLPVYLLANLGVSVKKAVAHARQLARLSS